MEELIIKHLKKNNINFGKEGIICDYIDDSFTSIVDVITDICKEYHTEQLRIGGVSFELPSDDIFDMPEVNLQNPLEEFYYYERPAYLEDDQKQFRERLQKAISYLKGN